RQQRWSDAEKQFQAAIALNPKDAAPRATLAAFYLNQGKKDLAEKVLQDAKTAMPDSPAGYRMLAEFYLGQHEWDKASAELASLHSEHPKDAVVSNMYGELLLRQNRLDDAAKIADELLKANPNDPAAMTLHGQILVRQGKAPDAVATLEKVVKNYPDNAAAHYQLGVAYAANQNLGQAESEWRQATKLQPTMIEPLRALASIAVRRGDEPLLEETGGKLMMLEPRSPDGYILHAQALLMKKDEPGAEADVKRAISVAPDNAAGYARMGDLRTSQKKYDEAEKYYSDALQRNPAAMQALNGLVNIALIQKQPAKALQIVQHQISLAPNISNFYVLLGQVELGNQDSAKAEEAFQKAVDLDKNNSNAFLFLSSVQVSRGSVDQAIASYRAALQSNPRDVRIYVALGSLLETRNQWQEAEDLYQKALQIQPDYALAANNLSYLMLEHGGNVNVALTLAQTGRKGMPDSPNAADTLGWAYYQQGVYSASIDLFQEAIKANPENPTYHYHLGMAYQKSNNFAMAKKQLEYTLQISPNYSQAGEIKKILAESAPQKN
ncbi:MAG: tetratricopeptide repeat protein, partial [Candidatus Acidiferrales bacterium]